MIQGFFKEKPPKNESQEYRELGVQTLGLVATARRMGHAQVLKVLVASEDGNMLSLVAYVIVAGRCCWQSRRTEGHFPLASISLFFCLWADAFYCLSFSLFMLLLRFSCPICTEGRNTQQFSEDGPYACCSLKAEPELQTRFRFKGKLGVGKSSLFKKIPFIPETPRQGCFNDARGLWHKSVFPSTCTLTYPTLVQLHTDL